MAEQKIKILPDYIANKIAAGEVIQRPESVVKELMENSIDANSVSIELIIKDAGKTLIQLVDDGIGMTEEDATISFYRHATSKISSVEDLSSIKSYGFRGEALSSIAAVSQLEIKTKTQSDDVGTVIRIEDNSNVIKQKEAVVKGTTVTVKNLFFNIPARRKFLKSNNTELKHIIETFKRIAISHPEINFKFYNDDDLVYDFRKGKLEERMPAVFENDFFETLIPVEQLTEYLNVKGFIAHPNNTSKSRAGQYLYVNNRFVISKSINHSIYTAYENTIQKGEYPFYVLFLEIDPTRFDINVHPSKLEIKFDDERNIYSFVHSIVKKALASYDLVPKTTLNAYDTNGSRLTFSNYKKTGTNDFSDRPFFPSNNDKKKPSVFSDEEIDILFGSINKEIKINSDGQNVESPFNNQFKEVYHERDTNSEDDDGTFIVSLQNKYILSQVKSGLMIIDQHAAHERILFEKALKSFEVNLPMSQQLLFPQRINLDPADYELIKDIESYLNKLGFEIKFLSKNTISILGIPSDIKSGNEKEILLEILNEYRLNEQQKSLELRDNIAASYACKAAIKTGDKITKHEMRLLVDQLFATSLPYVCPHGRPTVIKITIEEFDKRFGRL
ncbi:MAG: DNA mismatch repair endonuclease MutL [Ignavibacteriales bacterium]|nr:DNA mismatch repair endonuclease MutL [Ignavibacteriales bacterium]